MYVGDKRPGLDAKDRILMVYGLVFERKRLAKGIPEDFKLVPFVSQRRRITQLTGYTGCPSFGPDTATPGWR